MYIYFVYSLYIISVLYVIYAYPDCRMRSTRILKDNHNTELFL